MKQVFGVCLLSIFFVGCSISSFREFYTPWYRENYFPPEAYLSEGEEPVVIETSDIKTKFREISSRWYWCIGFSGVNAPDYSDSDIHTSIVKLSKENRAKVAIWEKSYSNTKSGVYSLPHTDWHTYTDSYGYTQSFTTTSYSTHSYSVDRFNYSVYLFIPIPQKYRVQYAPGVNVVDLRQNDRERYKSNTGCLINVVYKDTPAFYANLQHGDVITQINKKRIYTKDDFFYMRDVSKVGDTWKMTIIRNGKKKTVSLKFGL